MPFKGDILALDLATTLGWAHGPADPRDGLISYGSYRLSKPGSPQEDTFGAFMDWLGNRMLTFPPRLICYESPASPETMRGRTNKNTFLVLMGLPAIALAVAKNLKTPLIGEADVNEIRKYILGYRPKGGEGKKLIFERMKTLGFKPQDDNASDALAVHRFFAGYHAPELRVEVSPLFTKKLV